jgi:hypothetical protein
VSEGGCAGHRLGGKSRKHVHVSTRSGSRDSTTEKDLAPSRQAGAALNQRAEHAALDGRTFGAIERIRERLRDETVRVIRARADGWMRAGVNVTEILTHIIENCVLGSGYELMNGMLH